MTKDNFFEKCSSLVIEHQLTECYNVVYAVDIELISAHSDDTMTNISLRVNNGKYYYDFTQYNGSPDITFDVYMHLSNIVVKPIPIVEGVK